MCTRTYGTRLKKKIMLCACVCVCVCARACACVCQYTPTHACICTHVRVHARTGTRTKHKEAYLYGKRGLFVWQKRPIYVAMRPICMAKEAVHARNTDTRHGHRHRHTQTNPYLRVHKDVAIHLHVAVQRICQV